MSMKPPFVILSVSQGRGAAEDTANTIDTLVHLDRLGIPALKVLGRFAGKSETSIVLDRSRRDVAQTVAHKYNQEAILIVESTGEVYLELTGALRARQYIGEWTEVEDPGDHDYTYNQYSGKHYIIT